MRPSIGHRNKRFIALMMLVAWMFTVGVGLANACIPNGSQSVPLAHHATAASPAALAAQTTADGDHLYALGDDGEEHARSHQLHCQPVQAPERSRANRPTPEKSFDLDAIVAYTTRLAEPVPSAGHRPAKLRLSDPVVASLPLFIRFRRLIP